LGQRETTDVAAPPTRISSIRATRPVFFNSFEVKSTMGMIDQRGDWRRVVTDGHRQSQAEGQGRDEQPLSVEE
jgi:hypothetical protein